MGKFALFALVCDLIVINSCRTLCFSRRFYDLRKKLLLHARAHFFLFLFQIYVCARQEKGEAVVLLSRDLQGEGVYGVHLRIDSV